MKEKLIVLSMDAMVGEDVAYLRKKPNFSRLMAHSAQVGAVCTIYPSITYPAHVSIATGCRPGKTGLYTNTHVHTVAPPHPDWHLYSNEIHVEDIFAAAKRVGATTGAVYWPVTGNNPNIDWLLNEFFFYEHEDMESAFRAMGANDEAIAVAKENLHRWPTDYGHYAPLPADNQTFDDFIMGCMCSMIRRDQPDLLLVHNCILDTVRHRNGIFNHNVNAALDRTDRWLGEVIDAMIASGTWDNTNFVILSDHGQMDFVRRLKVNVLLRRGGFIDLDEAGKVADWRAYAQSNGMSVSVFLKDGGTEELKKEVYDYLAALRDEGVWGFEKIYTAQEAKERYGVYGDFAFMLETDGYTTFADGCTDPVVNPIDLSDYRLGKATHGYEPEKGPQPVFVARGPAFEPDARIPAAQVIDEAPTLAAVLGARMPQAEGTVLRDLLRLR
ncbi:MAG: alkaline phosphatase family protein [Oscillospiraceae bacterium]|nr:alkaline phosphatase family protein [Oscillospiraceae bacterium]